MKSTTSRKLSETNKKNNRDKLGRGVITLPFAKSSDAAEFKISLDERRAFLTSSDQVSTSIRETLLREVVWAGKGSITQVAKESLPRIENYIHSEKNKKRPSLGELYGDNVSPGKNKTDDSERGAGSPTPSGKIEIKLGWIQGVLIPCLLNIWGVMLFLRISWVVAQAGVGLSLIIIAISAVVCVITTLSMSAICSNGEVKGGGVYYIISRSLGPEMGASVGVMFAFANAVAASMNTIGFCDSLNDLLAHHGLRIIDNGVNDTRLIGAIALFAMCVICAVGLDWEIKAQNFLISVIVAAIANFLLGTIVGPLSNEDIAKGFTGFDKNVMNSNWPSDFRYSEGRSQNFFSVFAIFFPSVTGIQAGANISGDLKEPASAIPKGTMLSLLISMVSYALMVLSSGAGALRDASGNINDLVVTDTDVDWSRVSDCKPTCEYGLHNSYLVMQMMATWGFLIYAGCWAATLSTALTNLLSVPRLIQALGKDHIYPGLIFFSKAYGRTGEPYRGYVLTFVVSLLFLLIADLNTIAPLITNFYLASYALINFCTFHAAVVKPLGWRPTFKYYNVWLSLSGFLMCMAIMLLISWFMFLVTLAIFFLLYLVVHYRNPDVNWGSSAQAQMYKLALSSAFSVARAGEHVKNYRPQLLVLAGPAHVRPALLDLAQSITGGGSLILVANITQSKMSHHEREACARAGEEFLRDRKVRAFCTGVDGFTFELGARALMQASGVGRLTPNVLLMGYKSDWADVPSVELLCYFNIIHTAFENRLAVAILRIPGGLDSYARIPNGDPTDFTPQGSEHERRGRTNDNHRYSDIAVNGAFRERSSHHSPNDTAPEATPRLSSESNKKNSNRKVNYHQYHLVLTVDQLKYSNLFQKKKDNGTLDVWWLYDDGGLTILLPYILSQHSVWADTELRIFALASKSSEIEREKKNLANLLAKFRIDYGSLTMVEDIADAPDPETVLLFQEIIQQFHEFVASSSDCCITNAELMLLEHKTNLHLRLRELLLQNSSHAHLIVMSLPMPRKGSISAPLYMAWLEVMSRDLPPMLFVRGNQTSVLTFYS